MVTMVGVVLGVQCGALQALSGKLTTLSYLVFLTVSLAMFTIGLALASIVLWPNADKVVRP